MTEHTALPTTLMPMPAALPPIRYVAHIRTQRCAGCGKWHKWTEFYALNHLRSRTGAGNFVQNLVPVVKLEWNVEIETRPIEHRVIPVCHECVDSEATLATLSSLQTPPKPENLTAPSQSDPPTGAGKKTIADKIGGGLFDGLE